MVNYFIFQQEKNKSRWRFSSISHIFGKNCRLPVNEEISF